jgi:hypothetical protein
MTDAVKNLVQFVYIKNYLYLYRLRNQGDLQFIKRI